MLNMALIVLWFQRDQNVEIFVSVTTVTTKLPGPNMTNNKSQELNVENCTNNTSNCIKLYIKN